MKVCLMEFTNSEGETEAEVFKTMDGVFDWIGSTLEYEESELANFNRQVENQRSCNHTVFDINMDDCHYFKIYSQYEVM